MARVFIYGSTSVNLLHVTRFIPWQVSMLDETRGLLA